tara:strand:+ start:2891 stop:3655 length:765 start_codon:yes stop_codon:yes gene_type:complete
MEYKTNIFKYKYIKIKQKKIKYYLSTLLLNSDFNHAFFTKESSEIPTEQLGNSFNRNKINYFNNQTHSNLIVNQLNPEKRINADGIISDKANQNIWIYTADCMPIFFADSKTRLVAAIHCGRKGLEKKIIIQMLNQMEKLGSLRKDILVAIGPSISKLNYLVDVNCLKNFYQNALNEADSDLIINTKKVLKDFQNRYILDIRKYAFEQLISNKICLDNIDISDKCTYEINDEFYSWRREKTSKRNWNFITSQLN